MRRARSPALTALIGALAGATLGILGGALLEPVERYSYDARLALRGDSGWPPDLAAVTIDDASMREIGRWPWPRAKMAELIDRIHGAGADTVLFDFLLQSPTDEANDAALEKSLAGAVIGLGYDPTLGEPTRPDTLAPLLLPVRISKGPLLPAGVVLPLPRFLRGALAGHTFIYSLPDGVCRRHRPLLPIAGAEGGLPSAALVALAHHRGLDPKQIRASDHELRIPGLRALPMYQGQLAMDMVPGGRELPPVSAREVLASDPSRLRDLFAGKLVVVYDGSRASSDHEVSPVGTITPGGLLNAYAIRTMATGHTPIPASPLLTLLVAVLPFLVLASRLARYPAHEVLAVAGAAILLFGLLAVVLVRAADFFLPVVAPVVSMVAMGAILAAQSARSQEAERVRLRRLLAAASPRKAASSPALLAVAGGAPPAPAVLAPEATRNLAGESASGTGPTPTSSAAQLLLKGEELEEPVLLADRYQVVRSLGGGGMGAIFYGVDQVLDRPVAIKILKGSDSHAYRRFRREARAVARINHPNVVAIHEIGADAEVPFIVMEYVGGGSLHELLHSGDLTGDWRRACRLTASAGRGLGAAHALGIVHRDVKPANLLLVKATGDQVKVADFGIAKLAGAEQLTKEGSYIGTIGYLSPEQSLGQPVTPRSDVFSLGLTFYRLLTGKRPFDGTTAEIFHATLRAAVPDPRRDLPDLPPSIHAVFQAMTAKEVGDRPRDGTAAAEWIESALKA